MDYDVIDACIEREMRRLKIPGVALAIVEGDQIVHRRGFGQARPGGEAPTPHTPLFIGSLTKSFTALAVMQLVEAGKVDLDAPVQRYLPWFRVADPQASARITVRHLLNQTSGLSTVASERPAPIPFVAMFPWMLRGQLLIPALQIASVVSTLRQLRRWRADPEGRPRGARGWVLHGLLPLVPSLLVAFTLVPVLGKRRGYLRLYMPDYSWIAMVCGSFALAWNFIRTGLVLSTLRGRIAR